MSQIYVPTSVNAAVIKSGGSCYQLVGPSMTPPNASADDTYSDCDSCNSPCGDCAKCDISSASIAGAPGCCACVNTSVPMSLEIGCNFGGSKYLDSGGSCPYGLVTVSLECDGTKWQCTVSGMSICSGTSTTDVTWQGTVPGDGTCPPSEIECHALGSPSCGTGSITVSF